MGRGVRRRTTRRAHTRRVKNGKTFVRRHFMSYWGSLSSRQKAANQGVFNTFQSWEKLRGSERDRWGKVILREIGTKRVIIVGKRDRISKRVKPVKVVRAIPRKRLGRKYAPSQVKYGKGNYPTLSRKTGLSGVEERGLILVAEKHGNGDKIDLNAIVDSKLTYNENRERVVSELKPTMRQLIGKA